MPDVRQCLRLATLVLIDDGTHRQRAVAAGSVAFCGVNVFEIRPVDRPKPRADLFDIDTLTASNPMGSISPRQLGGVQDLARVYPDAPDYDVGGFTEIGSVPWKELEIRMFVGGGSIRSRSLSPRAQIWKTVENIGGCPRGDTSSCSKWKRRSSWLIACGRRKESGIKDAMTAQWLAAWLKNLTTPFSPQGKFPMAA